METKKIIKRKPILTNSGRSEDKYPFLKPEGDGKKYPPPTAAQSDALAAKILASWFGETIESAKDIKPSKPKPPKKKSKKKKISPIPH